MPKITKIYDMFAEEALANMRDCHVQGNGIETISESTPIYLQRWDRSRPLFSFTYKDENDVIREEAITLLFESELDIEPITPPSFNYLFWLEPKQDDTKVFTFKYIQCGETTPFPHLDIAFDDSTKISLNTPDTERLASRLENAYVFDAGKYKLLFVQQWQNGDQDWRIFGFHIGKEKDYAEFGEVALVNKDETQRVRLFKRERSKNVKFPNKFDAIDVLAYESVNFVDIGQAQEAQEAIKQRIRSGSALLSLWQTYSKIEFEIAKEEQDALGEIPYTYKRMLSNGLVSLTLKVNHDQSIMLKRLASANAQFETVESNTIITLINYDSFSYVADFDFDQYSFGRQGSIRLSLLGNEIVNKRRTFAIKAISRPKNTVVQNLALAMEDEADKMFENRQKPIPALSQKARTFLKEKFGIESLTQNQENAVSIALNNRGDITIIQGPPGTGKTTVVAAICFRLLELAGTKRNEQNGEKIILASAFQNDTIEHLASKIYTHGLPTVKIGRKTLGIRAEEQFIKELDSYLQEEINNHGGAVSQSVSSKLQNLSAVFSKEQNIDETISEIAAILPPDSQIPGIELDQLRDIKSAIRSFNRKSERSEALLNSIPNTEADYNLEDGFTIVNEILQDEFLLSQQEREFLENAPDINPDVVFMEKLQAIKQRLLYELAQKRKQAKYDINNEVLSWLERTIESARKFEESNYENDDDFIRSILSELREDLNGNTAYIRHTLQEYGETIAATNQLAGSKEMKDYQIIRNVILEEAARSNPLDLLIPMVKAQDRIIMVGDQNQLPHLLETEVAERSLAEIEDVDVKKDRRRLYEKSLFGILFDNVKKGNRIRCITLEEQFRMHPTIGDFISKVYYQGKLRPGTSSLAESKSHNITLPWAKGKTMIFCNVESKYAEGNGRSRYRAAEVSKVLSILKELESDSDFRNLSIGVITFYSRQVNLLLEEAAKPEYGYTIKGKDGYDIHPNYRVFDGDKEKLRIGTVDSFQGKEFDVVILSTVRSNSYPREEANERKVFGFLTLSNRLNVAFSRAKKLVIVVGDAEMFEDDFAQKHVPGLYEFCSNIARKEPYGNFI